MSSLTEIEAQHIAQRFAPVIYHAPDEPNLPTNVDIFLSTTSLWFIDAGCNPVLNYQVLRTVDQKALINQSHGPDCGSSDRVYSNGTRSVKKQRTFYLADAPDSVKLGSPDTKEWTTYFHVYPNNIGGSTIQYWRFHAYNTGKKISTNIFGKIISIEFGFHGGDWEGIHVVLNSSLEPELVRLLGHTTIEEVRWSSIERDGTHPVIYSEKDGHASLARGSRIGIRQETWGTENGAKVIWPGQGTLDSGLLINLGEKTKPLNEQFFIQYSGLWGSPSVFPDVNSIFYFISSGYWGPAYNETAMDNSGFITAWGAGAKEPEKTVDGVREFYPLSVSR